jgi:hypothetical protein
MPELAETKEDFSLRNGESTLAVSAVAVTGMNLPEQ